MIMRVTNIMLIDYDDGEEDDGDCICGGHLVAPMIYLRLRQLLQMVTIMIMNDMMILVMMTMMIDMMLMMMMMVMSKQIMNVVLFIREALKAGNYISHRPDNILFMLLFRQSLLRR